MIEALLILHIIINLGIFLLLVNIHAHLSSFDFKEVPTKIKQKIQSPKGAIITGEDPYSKLVKDLRDDN